jgi:hypothetical protein
VSFDGTVLWDLASISGAATPQAGPPAAGREVRRFGGTPMSFAVGAAFTPDGRTLATAHQNERLLRLWDVTTGRERHRLAGHPDAIASMALSPDGNTLASGGYDGTLILWDVATGKESWRGKYGSSLNEMAFSPDGNSLAWGGYGEKVVHLWEVRSRQERCRLRGHHGPVTGLDFAADNTRLASVSSDGTALVWDLTGGLYRGERPAVRLAPGELDRLGRDLGGNDAAAAYRAMCRLREAPGQAVTLLRQLLSPVAEPDARRLTRLIAGLDDEHFAARQEASAGLERLGDAAEPALRRALRNHPTAEAGRRMEELLVRYEAGRLRASRAVEVAEHLGSAEARRLLEDLARGAPGAWLTEQARAARERLARRAAPGLPG